MTIYELHLALLDGLDKVNNGTTPELSIHQRDRLLNLGCERFIKTKYSGNNQFRKGFEEGFKRQSDLANLSVVTELPVNTNKKTPYKNIKEITFVLPNDYWFSLYEELICQRTIEDAKCNLKETIEFNVRVINQTHREFSDNIRSPFHKPNNYQCFRMLESYDRYDTDNNIITAYVYDKLDVKYLIVSYIKDFVKLRFSVTYNEDNYKTLEYWMPIHTHQEIVDLAVAASIELFENQRVRTFPQQLSINE